MLIHLCVSSLCFLCYLFRLSITNRQHGERGASYRSQSPPPAHQTSPLTTVLTFLHLTKKNIYFNVRLILILTLN